MATGASVPRSAARGDGLGRFVAIVGLIVLSGAVLPLIQLELGTAPSTGEADQFTQMLVAPLYLASVGFLVTHSNRSSPFTTARAHLLTWGLVAVAVLSPLWSDEPMTSMRRSMALLASTIFALFLATRFSLRQLVHLLGTALLVIVVLSFVFAAVPDLGISRGVHEGAWRGAFTDKNSLGRAMVLATFTFATLALAARGPRRAMLWCAAASSALLVVLSRSTTSLVVLALMSSLVWILTGLRGRRTRLVAVGLGIVLVAGSALLLALVEPQTMLDALGKDATFSGRTELWKYVLRQAAIRPWLGYGFGGFWTGWTGHGADVWDQVAWMPPHAHNGVIDLGLELGLTGVLLLVVGFAATLRRALARIEPGVDHREMWPLLYLCFLVFANVTESGLVRQNHVFWILLCAVSFVVVRPAERRVTLLSTSAPSRASRRRASTRSAITVRPQNPQPSPGVWHRLRGRASSGWRAVARRSVS